MILLLGFAFISGLVTILAPCIWPLLPIILSSSIAGSTVPGHQRPLGITFGIMLSFAFFTLSISYLVSIFNFDPNSLRLIAVVVISFLGLTMIIPYLTTRFELLVAKLSTIFQPAQAQSTGFGGGLLTGLALGLVWAPCAGPILASIAALAATGRVSAEVVLVTLAYVTGVGIPLFAFAYGGQQLLTRSRAISPYTPAIQKVFGVVMIITAIAIYTNYDKVIQAKLLETFPQFDQALTAFESSGKITEQLNKLKGQEGSGLNINQSELFNSNTPAPEFTGITRWLNPEQPLTMAELRGKVVLIDFWTYTCINCIRTLPHVTAWYDKYKDSGFVVVGVHTPEFAFEKDTNNVLKAIDQFKIHYPVAQDNDYATWEAYTNRYWPAEYLIDAQGVIRRVHFGEGEYGKMEEAIQLLLKEAGQIVSTGMLTIADQTPEGQMSPETYLGSQRMQYLVPGGKVNKGLQTFTIQDKVPPNKFSLGGKWRIEDEFAEAVEDGVLKYNFNGGKVFLVMKPGQTPGKVSVYLDEKLVDQAAEGQSVKGGEVLVDTDRLYELIDLKGKPGNHLLKLKFDNGIKAFAFTFGS